MIFNRTWAMPSADTFSIQPIAEFVKRHLVGSMVSVDPFARNSQYCKFTNDLNPRTAATWHMDAEDFICMLAKQGVRADLIIFDPPYSPRQISECYQEIGRECGMKETQNAALYSRVKNAMAAVVTDDAIVLSFGWNSSGMGKGWEIVEILLVCHGGAHSDTICMAERKLPNHQGELPILATAIHHHIEPAKAP